MQSKREFIQHHYIWTKRKILLKSKEVANKIQPNIHLQCNNCSLIRFIFMWFSFIASSLNHPLITIFQNNLLYFHSPVICIIIIVHQFLKTRRFSTIRSLTLWPTGGAAVDVLCFKYPGTKLLDNNYAYIYFVTCTSTELSFPHSAFTIYKILELNLQWSFHFLLTVSLGQ